MSRSLWGKETELSAEIDKLRTEVEKAEKSLDHATPGVSIFSIGILPGFDIPAWLSNCTCMKIMVVQVGR